MKKKTILVVCGGTSNEREISLKSGKACSDAIKNLKYKVLSFDPAKENFIKIINYKADLIFNALHGRDGEDGIAQSYFEYFKIPYTHSGILSSMNAMDKIISKKIFKKNKIRTPDYIELKGKFNKPVRKGKPRKFTEGNIGQKTFTKTSSKLNQNWVGGGESPAKLRRCDNTRGGSVLVRKFGERKSSCKD